MEVVRPEIKTGLCPNGTQPCNQATTIDNTVCYANATNCPITDIKFSNTSEQINYTTVAIDENRFIAFSKLQDSLPIVQTSVELKPC